MRSMIKSLKTLGLCILDFLNESYVALPLVNGNKKANLAILGSKWKPLGVKMHKFGVKENAEH